MANTEHCPLKYMYYTMYLTQKQIQSKYSAKYSASDKVRPSLGEAPAPYIHLVGIPCSPDCRTTCDASMQ